MKYTPRNFRALEAWIDKWLAEGWHAEVALAREGLGTIMEGSRTGTVALWAHSSDRLIGPIEIAPADWSRATRVRQFNGQVVDLLMRVDLAYASAREQVTMVYEIGIQKDLLAQTIHALAEIKKREPRPVSKWKHLKKPIV